MSEPTVKPALGALVRHARNALEAAGKTDAALDARLIVEHFTETSRTDAVLDPKRAVTEAQHEAVLSALDRRLGGEPVYRIVGARAFYGLLLKLSPETLEPRPDTEALVDLALPHVRKAASDHGLCRILDLGTGTGAVALALLKEEPRAQAIATDISDDALETATANADINEIGERFSAKKSDWFADLSGKFHVIVSNPPYIPSKEIALLEREVRDHDPLAALDGGPDGLAPYRRIAAGAAPYLEQDGMIVLEIGQGQQDDVSAIFAIAGFQQCGQASDLGGVIRALAFTAENH